MNNQLQVFENEEFGKVRVLEIDGQPWFVGKDVTDILGYDFLCGCGIHPLDEYDGDFEEDLA